jgi:sulfonate dioxygenase
VAFWDNRVVVHRAVPGGYNPQEREGKRTAVFGEKPFLDKDRGVTLSQYTSMVTNGANGHSNGETGAKTVSNGADHRIG